MPTGSVRTAGLALSDSANKNSSQAFTKARMPAVKTPGAASGSTTRARAPSRVQPSIMAAFSRSRGMLWKKLTSTKVHTGKLSTTYGKISAM
jgi:hypothetical protein